MSLATQTIKAQELILVLDGPIPKPIDIVIENFTKKLFIKRFPINKKVGLGEALRQGLLQCQYEIVARMDDDDICHPKRFEKQIQFLDENKAISIVGSWISEFENDENIIVSQRCPPCDPDQLARFARWRCPFNHMSVMFRKKDIISSGNYNSLKMAQDYHLWARMACRGYKFANIPEFLIKAKAGNHLYQKRGGLNRIKCDVSLYRDFYKMGFINITGLRILSCARFLMGVLPKNLKKLSYKTFLRNPPKRDQKT